MDVTKNNMFFQTYVSMGLQVHVFIAVSCKVKHHDFGMASFDRTVRNKKSVKGCSIERYFIIIMIMKKINSRGKNHVIF